MIWEEVPACRSKFDDLTNLLSYCFYIPLVMMGPLVNYKEYYVGVSHIKPRFDGDNVLFFFSAALRLRAPVL